jgi:hypothetical protein
VSFGLVFYVIVLLRGASVPQRLLESTRFCSISVCFFKVCHNKRVENVLTQDISAFQFELIGNISKTKFHFDIMGYCGGQ